MADIGLVLGLIAILSLCAYWSSIQENWKQKDRESNFRALTWWSENACTECGGEVRATTDPLSGYPYAAECLQCGAKYDPSHEGEAPWVLDERHARAHRGRSTHGRNRTPELRSGNV